MTNVLSKYNPQKIHFALLIGLAILIPSGFYNFEGLIIALLLANWLFGLKGYSKLVNIPKSTILLSAFFALYMFGLLFTSDISGQTKAITKHLAYVLIPFSFIGFSLDAVNLERVKKVFIWSTIAFVLVAFGYAFFDYLNTGKSTIYVHDSVQSKFTYYGLTRVFDDWHPTYISFFCNLSFIFAYNIYFLRKKYLLSFLIGAVLAVSILLLNSFIGIITFGFLTSFFFIRLFKKSAAKILASSAILVLAFLFYHYNPLNLSKIEKFKKTSISFTDGKESRNILNLRLAKWESSYKLFLTSPLVGVSAGDYRNEVVKIYEKEGYEYATEHRYSSHNQYLYFLASFGIIGFILFLLVLFYPLRYKGQISLFIFVFSLFCLTEDMLLRQQGMVAFTFFYVILQIKKISDD